MEPGYGQKWPLAFFSYSSSARHQCNWRAWETMACHHVSNIIDKESTRITQSRRLSKTHVWICPLAVYLLGRCKDPLMHMKSYCLSSVFPSRQVRSTKIHFFLDHSPRVVFDEQRCTGKCAPSLSISCCIWASVWSDTKPSILQVDHLLWTQPVWCPSMTQSRRLSKTHIWICPLAV